jgi:hypothetical protein
METKNNNLIYTVCVGQYTKILKMFVDTVKKFNDTNILVINSDKDLKSFLDENFCLSETIPNLDWQYSGRFIISELDKFHTYENYLYLDLDILCQKNIDVVFDIIESNKEKIHSVKSYNIINNLVVSNGQDITSWFKPINHNFKNDSIVYNSGTIGFNKKLMGQIKNLYNFVNSQKKYGNCDQPLFNSFMDIYDLGLPTLNEFVWLDQNEKRNVKKMEDLHLIHFCGEYCNIVNKEKRMKNIFNLIK